jgi:uracil-DNA glycosylase
MAVDVTQTRTRATPTKSPLPVEEGGRGEGDVRSRSAQVRTPPPNPLGQGEAASQHAATLAVIAASARACRICEAQLPLGPRPVFRVSTTARLHETGIPWNDPSGDRLRRWLQIDRDTFYDEARIAIVPMGLCYPGRLPNGGDAPPRPECAPLWRERLVTAMPNIRLTLLVGIYALTYTLGRGAMTDHVRAFRDSLPCYFPLPHPSWRTTAWERKNPWFEAEVLPALRGSVTAALR